MNNSFNTQKNQFNLVQGLFNKGLEEMAQEEKNETARDDEYAEECERDRTADFEQTRGTQKQSKYFNN